MIKRKRRREHTPGAATDLIDADGPRQDGAGEDGALPTDGEAARRAGGRKVRALHRA